MPNDKIMAEVNSGGVTLSGDVNWNYQREAAKSAISYLAGVRGVTNNIRIKTEINDAIEKENVKNALARHWSINSDDIDVKAEGTKITLSGTVTSLYQKEEAGRIAWKTPGVWSVENKLEVEYRYALTE